MAPEKASTSAMSRTDDLLRSHLTARVLGTALVIASCDPASVLRGARIGILAVVVLAAVAWWAAPMTDARPVRTSARWSVIARERRTTLLAAGSVAVAAATEPPTWTAACVTGLLLAYLLVTDTWTMGATAPRTARRPAPALTAAAAAAVVFLIASAPIHSTSWSRLPAALAIGATVTCVALALRQRRAG
jgi:hypothetical protein